MKVDGRARALSLVADPSSARACQALCMTDDEGHGDPAVTNNGSDVLGNTNKQKLLHRFNPPASCEFVDIGSWDTECTFLFLRSDFRPP